MAWATELASGDVIDLDGGKILIAVTANGANGSRIRIHADRSISIVKNGRKAAEATQEGFGATLNSEGV
uniref:Uncharacterized protein n=1 Tax=Desulfovibrio sp. U5L TaxID=596152 RepID=I2Q030_9BACT